MFGIIKKIKKVVNLIHTINKRSVAERYDHKNVKVNIGQIQAHINSNRQEVSSINEVEFQVFSQFGDDGIIQWLISKIDIPNKTFIEFGVENYIESNTRFLLINNKWKGLVI